MLNKAQYSWRDIMYRSVADTIYNSTYTHMYRSQPESNLSIFVLRQDPSENFTKDSSTTFQVMPLTDTDRKINKKIKTTTRPCSQM